LFLRIENDLREREGRPDTRLFLSLDFLSFPIFGLVSPNLELLTAHELFNLFHTGVLIGFLSIFLFMIY